MFGLIRRRCSWTRFKPSTSKPEGCSPGLTVPRRFREIGIPLGKVNGAAGSFLLLREIEFLAVKHGFFVEIFGVEDNMPDARHGWLLLSLLLQLCSVRRWRCQAPLRNLGSGSRPFFQPPFSLERAELPLPDLAKENHSQVGSAEVLSGSIGDASLSYLCNVVLSVHVSNGSFCRIPEILKTDPAG